jgi:ParB family chromosome partitioning protein
MSARKGGLGRGLDALIPVSNIPPEIKTATGILVADRNEIDLNLISANPKQPRTVFDEDQLAELALSIKEVGLLQPPVVRSIGDGKYQLIMGERRYRAAKLAGLKTIPVIIRQTNDDQLLREALIENIHRSQLNPLEEGAAYQQLLNDFGYTHDELANKLSKSRPVITNTMRLLNLPAVVQRRVAAGVISAGHARSLLSLTDQKEIENLANRIVAEGLTVRAVEEIVASGSAKVKGGLVKRGKIIAPKIKDISDDLSDYLDTRVSVELGKKKGKIVIEFATIEDLERINKVITANNSKPVKNN